MIKKLLLVFIFLTLISCTNKVDKLFDKSQKLESQEKYLEAIKILDLVIELKPDYLGAYINRGADYAALQNYKKAIENYKQVIEIDSTNQLALFNLANNYQHRFNDFSKAIEFYTKALGFEGNETINISIKYNNQQLSPYEVNENEIYFERGTAYYQIKQYENALFDFRQSFNEEQNNPESIYMVGASLYMLGRKTEACVEFNKAKLQGYELAKSEYKLNCE